MTERRVDNMGLRRWWPHLVQVVVVVVTLAVTWTRLEVTLASVQERQHHLIVDKASTEYVDARFDAILRECDDIKQLIRNNGD